MRRLFATFALICVLSQIPLPFFAVPHAKAAELDNIVESNVKIIPSKLPVDMDDLVDYFYLPAEKGDTEGIFGEPGFQYFANSQYPMNNLATPETAGHGILVHGKKGYTSFGGVLDFYFKISSDLGDTGETNDLDGILSSNKSNDGFFLAIGTSERSVANLGLTIEAIAFYKAQLAAKGITVSGELNKTNLPEIGLDPQFTPSIVTGAVNFKIPGATTRYSNIGNFNTTVSAYNVDQFLQRSTSSTKTGFGFSIPITDLAPSTKYYAQIFVDEDGGGEWTAYSKTLEFTTLAKNPDGTENYGSYDPGKDIADQLNTISEYTDDEASEEVSAEVIGELLTCSWRKPLTWFKGCMVIAFHDLIYTASAKVLEIGAKLMDIFIGFSISNFFYSDNIGVILEGWKIVRDVSNILFIFILLWTAFNIILRVNHHFNANKVITQLIIIGLLINFSLFFTRIVIDAGNIAARVFYNAITVKEGTDDLGNIDITTIENEKPKIKSLSGAITQGLGVTQMIDSDATKRALEGRNGLVFLVLVLGTVMNLVAAWTFFQCGFFFVGRIISLWAAMIFAPFAFTSTILPELAHVPKIGWGVWLKNLLSAAFGAAFFMFFLFLIIKFANSPILSDLTANMTNDTLSTGTLFAVILLQFLFIIGLIKAAKSIAGIMAGEFGGALAGAVEGAAKFAGGAVLGAGMGATAIFGRNTLGRAAAGVSQERLDSLKEKATGTGFGAWRARQQLNLIEGTKKASFDVRQNKVASQFSSATGINLNSGLGLPGLKAFNTANTIDGFKGARDRKSEKEMKRAERLGINETKKHHIEDAITQRTKDVENEEEALNDLRRNLARAKAEPSKSFSGKTQAEWQDDVNTQERKVRDLKKGTSGTYGAGDIGSTKYDGSKVTQADVGKTKKDPGLEDMEKALKNNDKALVREYLWNRMKKYSPYEMTDEERDASGQIKKFGHATTVAAKDKGRRFAESLFRSLYEGGLQGFVVGAALGPVGLGVAIGTGAVFAREMKGIGLSNWLADYSKSMNKAVHDLNHGADAKGGNDHGHGVKDKYQGPTTNIFNNLFTSGGSSGKASSGGGGHGHGGGSHH